MVWRRQAAADPIGALAGQIAAASRLLCFDEFQVTNIADAMLLGRLFTALFEAGVVVVATSNVAPGDLYAGGLQRDRFLPFIDLIERHLDLLALDGETDYRRRRIRDLAVYLTPLGPDSTRALGDAFARLTDDAIPVSLRLTAQGRVVEVPRAAKGVAWFQLRRALPETPGSRRLSRHRHAFPQRPHRRRAAPRTRGTQ